MVQQPNGETNGNDVVKNGNYDLREKEPISLTKAQRKEINAQVKAILQTNPKLEDLTEEQKNILRQYTGEGGLSAGETIESLYQYYTSYPVIKSIYKALNDMGVKMTKALEPAVGSGNFIGMNPELKWTAIDLDPINAKITELLYPNAKVVNDSFLKYIDNDFDLVVSNVPFAQKTAETKYSLHDSFFTHALDRVKDGGIIAFITSTSTMDKAGAEARQEMMNSADFLGAVRLPSGTFSDTHTQVTTDLIFLQKRP
jgi:type I restriction-modification system DNA methylase subunit